MPNDLGRGGRREGSERMLGKGNRLLDIPPDTAQDKGASLREKAKANVYTETKQTRFPRRPQSERGSINKKRESRSKKIPVGHESGELNEGASDVRRPK